MMIDRLPRLGIRSVVAMTLLIVAACSAIDGSDATPTPRQTATREVLVATFTATEVVPPEDQTATAEVRSTSAAMTATEAAINPHPTPTFANPTVPESQVLTPPMATITGLSSAIPATLGSYGWVFSDTPPTVAAIEAPLVLLEHEPVDVPAGSELTIAFAGAEYRTPPVSMEAGVYSFDENSGIPTNPQGGTGDQPAFVVKTEPDQQPELAPGDLRFTIDVPRGHYAIRVQGHWSSDPRVTSTENFVTWIFNVNVT